MEKELKNIYIIEVKSPHPHIFSFTLLPRLGGTLLATILRDRGFNTKVFIEDINLPGMDQLEDADMICITSITSTAPRAFVLASQFKKKGILVAIGGVHSTFLPEESLLHADYVVRGEGEEALVELVESLRDNLPLDKIKGLSYIENGVPKHNADRELIQDLDAALIPDFSLVHGWEKALVTPIATSRGCPFACKFCSVVPMFGRELRFKSDGRVIEEIKLAKKVKPKGHVFFIDDNFTAKKDRTKKLLRRIIEEKIDFEWSAQVRTDAANDSELIELMKKAGCRNVYIGFESVNPKTLVVYRKSQSLADIEKSIKVFQAALINIHGMFVLGADTDDILTFKRTTDFAKRLRLNSVQFMMLTPLPGTPIFWELKNAGRIIHMDWSKYDAHHAVFEPKLMTAFELHVETLKAMGRFYSLRAAAMRLLKLDLTYFVVMLYGKWSIRKALNKKWTYFKDLKYWIAEAHEKDVFGEVLVGRKKSVIGLVINDPLILEQSEAKFFRVFLRELAGIRELTIEVCEDVSRYSTIFGVTKDKVGIANIEAFSLFKICERIGLLFKVKRKKVRKAYEEALQAIEQKEFECSKIQLIFEK